MKMFKQLLLAFLALIFLYFVLMTAVFAIPDAWIEKNVHAALAVLKEEGEYPHYFFDYPYGQADNNTDMMMYRNLLTEDGLSAVQAAMVPSYSRYWHGYALFLRPVSVFFSIANLRYINMAILIVFLCLCFWRICGQIGVTAAIAFLLGLLSAFFWLAPFNLQYYTVTMLTLVFSFVMLEAFRRKLFRHAAVWFLCFGSLTSFFDYLTFPILTLGYPLILLLLTTNREPGKDTFTSQALLLLSCCACWLAGYVLTFLSKGLLGSLILGTNVMQEILEASFYRMNGALPEGYSIGISAWMSIQYNIAAFFNLRNLCLLAGSSLCLVIAAWHRLRAIHRWTVSLPLLVIALLPYVWYAVMANHSVVHVYFTFKAQAVTFFGVCAFVISASGLTGNRKSPV